MKKLAYYFCIINVATWLVCFVMVSSLFFPAFIGWTVAAMYAFSASLEVS